MPTVALTTTPDRATKLVARCVEVGLEPTMMPCIEFVAAGDDQARTARGEASSSDWLVVTSARAIESLWPDGGMPDVATAAVGAATAGAVERAGGTAVVVGDGGAREMVSRMGRQIEGATVFFPHAHGAGTSTVAALEAAGASVVARPVYEIRPIPPGRGPVDAVVFGSPTAVRGWAMSRGLDGLVVGAIGDTTARAVERLSTTPDVVPPRPSFDHLVELVAEHLRDRSAV